MTPVHTLRTAGSLLLLAGLASGWWDTWPYLEHQDLLDRSIDIAMARYPDMAAEVDGYRDELLSGTHDEDYDEDAVNGPYCDYSGYCVAVPGAYWPTATRPLDAIEWVHDSLNPNNWDAAVLDYGPDRAAAYYRLGHILHNLQDLFVPAHAHISPHGSGTGGLVENHSWPLYVDNFEQWCEVTATELGRAEAARIPEASLDTLMVRAAVFAVTDAESAGFLVSQYHAPPDAPGEWGRYRPYPSGGYPCGNDRIDNDLANGWSLWLVPACCEHAAGAIRAFWLECNPTGVAAPAPRPAPAAFRLRSPARPGAVLFESAAPVRTRFIGVDGRVRAVASGTVVRCPALPAGTWCVRVETGRETFCRQLVVTR